MKKKTVYILKSIYVVLIIIPLYAIGMLLHIVSALIGFLGLYLMGFKYTALDRLKDVKGFEQNMKDWL
jgi:hypothetical protein